MRRSERGAVSVLAIAIVVLGCALALGAARLGRVLHDRAGADTAADAAALAAAGDLARGEPPEEAAAVASASATENGARLLWCECAGRRATVSVQVGEARARARAEVRFECSGDPPAC